MIRSKNLLLERKRNYLQTFEKESVPATAVLKDLERFCRAHESTFSPDPRVHALLEGRREVYLRIMDYLELELDDLMVKYKGVKNE